MTTKLDVFNQALSQVNRDRVYSLTEESIAADICNLYYEQSRRILISDGEWQSHTNFGVLSLVLENTTTYKNNFQYIFGYPTDILKLLDIINLEEESIKFSIQYRLSQKIILTNEKKSFYKYIQDVEDLSIMSENMINALSWKLSSMIAIPLLGETNGRAVRNDCMNAYQMYLNDAWVQSRAERPKAVNYGSSIVKGMW